MECGALRRRAIASWSRGRIITSPLTPTSLVSAPCARSLPTRHPTRTGSLLGALIAHPRLIRRRLVTHQEAVGPGTRGLSLLARPAFSPRPPPGVRSLYSDGGARHKAGPVLYDPSEIGRHFRWRPHVVVARALRIAAVLGAVRARVWLKVGTVETRAVALRKALISLGPAFVKLGQGMATRVDLFPPAVCRELSLLQDRMPPFPLERALAFIHAELGSPAREIFDAFGPAPAAAASLGQVYKARLRSGDVVAVKVQRPGLLRQMALDSYVLRSLVQLTSVTGGALATARSLLKRVTRTGTAPAAGPAVTGFDESEFLPPGAGTDGVAVVDEIAARMFEEVDYAREARSQRRFRALYRSAGVDAPGAGPHVVVPRVYGRLSSASVLTTEWVDGCKLTDGPGLAARQLDTSALLELGVRCSLQQMLVRGFYHGDPHPGNLLATADGGLAYLDFGCVGHISAGDRTALLRLVVDFVNRDGAALARDFSALGFLPDGTDLVAVAAAVDAALSEGGVGGTGAATPGVGQRQSMTQEAGASTAGDADGSESAPPHPPTGGPANVDFRGAVALLSGVMRRFGFVLPSHFALIIRSLGVLEGTATAIDPGFKVVARAYPYVLEQLLADRRPATRRALRSVLLRPDGGVRWTRLQRLITAAAEAAATAPGGGGGLGGHAPGGDALRSAVASAGRLLLKLAGVEGEGGAAGNSTDGGDNREPKTPTKGAGSHEPPPPGGADVDWDAVDPSSPGDGPIAPPLPRGVILAAAASDATDFLLSPAGAPARAALARDALSGVDSILDSQESQESLASLVALLSSTNRGGTTAPGHWRAAAGAAASLVAQAPVEWVALAARAAANPEARSLAGDVASGAAVRAAQLNRLSRDAKAALFDAIEGSERGIKTSSRPAVEAAIDALADLRPASAAANASRLLTGTWRVLWTSEKEVLFCLEKGLFATGPAGEVYQIIDVPRRSLLNVIEFIKPEDGTATGALVVDSSLDVTSLDRVDFAFSGARLRAGSFKFDLPPVGKGFYSNPFIDNEIRITRDSRGDTLVIERCKFEWSEDAVVEQIAANA